MSDASILREFLVKLGYDADEAQYKKFVKGVETASKKAAEMSAAVEAAAIAVEAAVVKIAGHFEQLYWASQRLGASAQNVAALGFAFSQLGGSTQQAQGVLRSIQDGLLTYGKAGEGVLHALGVATEDGNGHLRDTSAILGDLTKRWQAMGDKQRAYWEANSYFGIDMDTFQVLMRDTGQFEVQRDAMAKKFGVNQDQAAAASKRFMQDFRTVQMAVSLMFDKILLKLQVPLESQLQKFLTWLEANGDTVADKAIIIGTAFIHFLTGTGELIGRVITGLIALDHATGGWSTKIIEAALAWKFLGIGALVTGLFSLGRAIFSIDLAGMFAGAGEAVAGLGAALLGPLGIILAVGAALAVMMLRSQEFRDALVGAFQDALPGIQQAFGALIAAAGQLWTALAPLLKLIWDLGQRITYALGPTVVQMAANGLRELADIINILADGIKLVADLLRGRWTDAWNDAKAGLKGWGKLARDELAGMGDIGKTIAQGAAGAADDRYEGDHAKPKALGSNPLLDWWHKLTGHARRASGAATALSEPTGVFTPGSTADVVLTKLLDTANQIRDIMLGQPANDNDGKARESPLRGLAPSGGGALGAEQPRSRDLGWRSNGALAYTAEQIKGITAGLYAESRLNPNAQNPTSGAYGIGQWLGKRQRDFEAIMGRGLKGSSFEDQAQFLLWELSHTEKRAGDLIRSQATAQDALAAMLRYYERPGPGLSGDLARGNAYLAGHTMQFAQTNHFNIHSDNPHGTAQAVGAAQRGANDDMMRRARKIVA